MTTALRTIATLLSMRNLACFAAIAVLLVACSNNPSTPPATGAPGTGGPDQATSGPGATAGPESTASPGEAAAPTSMSKIIEALKSGVIDEPTSLLYRLYASFNDDRLPAAYQGEAAEDNAVGVRVRQLWPTLTADQQAAMLPFMVRPTSPKSVWLPAASASAGGAQLASVRLTATACQDGFLRKQVSPTVPIVIWGQCGGMSEANVAALVDEVAQDMAELWEPMTKYMGEPIGDANVVNDAFADSPEGGDGLLDIYLVDSSRTLHGRGLSTRVLAVTSDWTPWVGSAGSEASSAYIVVNDVAGAGVNLRSTLAHEFFHVLQDAHNNTGVVFDNGTKLLWFVEATAKWAEHEFVPAANGARSGTYAWFTGLFQRTTESLAYTNSQNEYASWIWPLFMQQELGRPAVATAWKGLEGKSGYDNTTAVLNGVLSFKDHFRDFAVRVWNQDLEPGDPVGPRFQGLDGSFPTTQPAGARARQPLVLPSGKFLQLTDQVRDLSSVYTPVEPDCKVGSVTFDFSVLLAGGDLDVDLVLNSNGTWQRRKVTPGEEVKVSNMSNAIVVVSNHGTDPNAGASLNWTVTSDQATCNTKGQYSVSLTGSNKTGAGTYAGVADIYCTQTKDGTNFFWTALMVLPNAPFGSLTDFNLQENPSGWDSVSATAGGIDAGLWFARSDFPQQTAEVTGTGVPGTDARIVGDGTFQDAGKTYTIHVTAECSETYYAEP